MVKNLKIGRPNKSEDREAKKSKDREVKNLKIGRPNKSEDREAKKILGLGGK